MSERFIKACIVCWLTTFAVLEFLGLLYQASYISLDPVERLLNNCKKDYFYSSISISENNYSFDDVLTCKDFEGKDCLFSVKKSKENLFYSEKHNLDKSTKDFLSNFPKNKVNYIPDINELRIYPAIDELLNNVVSDVKQAFFKVAGNKIYIITTSNPKKFCNEYSQRVLRDK